MSTNIPRFHNTYILLAFILTSWLAPFPSQAHERASLLPAYSAGEACQWTNAINIGLTMTDIEESEALLGLTWIHGITNMGLKFQTLTQQETCAWQQWRPSASIAASAHRNWRPPEKTDILDLPYRATSILFLGMGLLISFIAGELKRDKSNCSQPVVDQEAQTRRQPLPHSAIPATSFAPQAISGQDELLVELGKIADDAGFPPPCKPAETIAAASSNKGNFRSDNQDFHIALQLGDVTALLVADGCGGLPYGAYAAYMAVREAAGHLIRCGCGHTVDDIVPLARETLFKASAAMEQIAATATPPIQEGFRTTLIVILADSKRYAFAYAGDGGGMVIRKTGEIEKFLFPQKHPDYSNVLMTSLGPTLEGEPASGAIPRYPGDLLLAGSDGVWDYADEFFPPAVAQYLAKAQGDLPATCMRAVDELAEFTHNGCHICTDNLTLGLIATSLTPETINIKEPS